jgi:hypothetical protein
MAEAYSEMLSQISDIRTQQAETDRNLTRIDTEVGQVVSVLERIERRQLEQSRVNWAPMSLAASVIISFIGGLFYLQTQTTSHLRTLSDFGDASTQAALVGLTKEVDRNSEFIRGIKATRFSRADWQYEKGQIDGELDQIREVIDEHQDGHPHKVISRVEGNAKQIDYLQQQLIRLQERLLR